MNLLEKSRISEYDYNYNKMYDTTNTKELSLDKLMNYIILMSNNDGLVSYYSDANIDRMISFLLDAGLSIHVKSLSESKRYFPVTSLRLLQTKTLDARDLLDYDIRNVLN